MNAFEYKQFILANSYAAVSVLEKNERIYATDGIECKIHIFESDGTAVDNICTLRPYRRLRRYGSSEMMTALGCCNQRRVYFIDGNFQERGFVELDSSCVSEQNCGCGCGCNCAINPESDVCGEDGLIDASLTCIGNEAYIVGVFPKTACIFDMNGNRVTQICQADCGELLTDFITPNENLFAFSSVKGNIRTISVSENGITQSAILGRGHTLRMLIYSENNEIIGLFGNNYIYNRLIPIYQNGILSLP